MRKTPSHPNPPASNEMDSLIGELMSLRGDMIEFDRKHLQASGDLHPVHRQSARNLLQYLAFRRRDLRSLQERLAELGLSSLGRAESHVLATIEAVIGALHRSGDNPAMEQSNGGPPIDFAE